MKFGKIYFTRMDNELPEEIREITIEESDSIKNAGKILHEFDYFQRRLLEIELNQEDLFRTIERYRKDYLDDENKNKLGYDYKYKSFVDINRAFINLVSSFKAFVEHISNKLREYYGYWSEELKDFLKYTNDLYDGHFSYKLLIRLRDFGLHKQYPIQSIHFDKEIAGIEKYRYKVKAQFRKSVFLESKTLSKKIGKDLETYGELFDVEPFVNELIPLIKRLFIHFVNIHKDYFLDSASLIGERYKEGGTLKLGITTLKMDSHLLKHETKIIPVQMSLDFFNLIS